MQRVSVWGLPGWARATELQYTQARTCTPGSAASPAWRSRLRGAPLRAPARRRRPLACRAGSQVEYKYVVRNGDGTPTAWKPGSNFQRPRQSEGGCGGAGATAAAAADSLPGALRVSDAWDESWRRVEARRPRRHLCKPCVYDVRL